MPFEIPSFEVHPPDYVMCPAFPMCYGTCELLSSLDMLLHFVTYVGGTAERGVTCTLVATNT